MSDTRWLFLCQSAPYRDPLTIAGLDALMAAGAFGQQSAVLFSGRGVQQLLATAPVDPGQRHLPKTLAGLPLYDIEQIYVDARDWPEGALATSGLTPQPLHADGIAKLVADADHVVSF